MSETLNVDSIARRFSQSSTFGMERVPKYLRLSNVMLDAIESGEFRPGSQMPGERDLMDILPVSLGTIQKAMKALVEQGVVFRRAGMGTFVSGATPQANHTDEEKVAKGDLEQSVKIMRRDEIGLLGWNFNCTCFTPILKHTVTGLPVDPGQVFQVEQVGTAGPEKSTPL